MNDSELIRDHPFLDNNGITYRYGVCVHLTQPGQKCGRSSSEHTHRIVNRGNSTKRWVVPDLNWNATPIPYTEWMENNANR